MTGACDPPGGYRGPFVSDHITIQGNTGSRMVLNILIIATANVEFVLSGLFSVLIADLLDILHLTG